MFQEYLVEEMKWVEKEMKRTLVLDLPVEERELELGMGIVIKKVWEKRMEIEKRKARWMELG